MSAGGIVELYVHAFRKSGLMDKKLISYILVVFLFFFVGCGSKKQEVSITGTVKVNGKPVDGGTIQFVPVNKDTFEGGGLITNGTFKATVPYGEMLVKFRGIEYLEKDADGKPLGGNVVTNEQGGVVSVSNPPSKRIIPDRYWFNSDVHVTVKTGKEPFDFDLDAE